ncbi:DUF2802 domain-containing protein [Thalassotalea euphylliae]|uniref:DUF2802 domain-containing protein n=1 Tax=Thalassotalea euphylliae TaxID=1655234 RepID=UPI00362E4791
MEEVLSNPIIITALVLSIFAIAVTVVVSKIISLNRQQELVANQLSTLELLTTDVQASVKTLSDKLEQHKSAQQDSQLENDQVSRQLEHRIKQLQSSFEHITSQIKSLQEEQPQDKLYSRAYKLAGLGADVEEIMKECELPRAEVEMLLAIYRKQQS